MNSVNYESVENLTYQEDGYYHLLVPTFYEYGDNANKIVDFVRELIVSHKGFTKEGKKERSCGLFSA